MKVLLIKLIVLLLCVPVYPFYLLVILIERNSYLGSKVTMKSVSQGYWSDVKETLMYKKEDK